MKILNKILISAVFALGFGSFTTSANACGTITVAEMNWASAEMFAHVDKMILENGYGCDVELVPGDTMPTATSMMEKASRMLLLNCGSMQLGLLLMRQQKKEDYITQQRCFQILVKRVGGYLSI